MDSSYIWDGLLPLLSSDPRSQGLELASTIVLPNQALPKRVIVALLLGGLVALSFFVAALVTFIQEDDWPARYVSAGTGILAAMFIAVRRRARKR